MSDEKRDGIARYISWWLVMIIYYDDSVYCWDDGTCDGVCDGYILWCRWW